MTLLVHSDLLGDNDAVDTPYADSPWVVLKFGGTSVATSENWRRIERLLRERIEAGLRPFVCLSALAGVSNELVKTIEVAAGGNDAEPHIR